MDMHHFHGATKMEKLVLDLPTAEEQSEGDSCQAVLSAIWPNKSIIIVSLVGSGHIIICPLPVLSWQAENSICPPKFYLLILKSKSHACFWVP